MSLTLLLQCCYNCTSGPDLKPGGKHWHWACLSLGTAPLHPHPRLDLPLD